MPVPGASCKHASLEDGRALVERIEPRDCNDGAAQREPGGRRTMAANVNLLVAVTAPCRDRRLAPVTLDQLLAFAQLEEIEAAVVFTKPDLAEPASEQTELLDVYSRTALLHALGINPKTRRAE